LHLLPPPKVSLETVGFVVLDLGRLVGWAVGFLVYLVVVSCIGLCYKVVFAIEVSVRWNTITE